MTNMNEYTLSKPLADTYNIMSVSVTTSVLGFGILSSLKFKKVIYAKHNLSLVVNCYTRTRFIFSYAMALV